MDFERVLLERQLDEEALRQAKEMGFSDREIARIKGMSEEEVRTLRSSYGLFPAFKGVDTCAGEFFAYTPYYYSSYERPYYHIDGTVLIDED